MVPLASWLWGVAKRNRWYYFLTILLLIRSVNTQSSNQQYQDPWVAIVVDPKQTMSTGRVEIGAFRTYPKDYNPPPSETESEWQYVPKDRIEEVLISIFTRDSCVVWCSCVSVLSLGSICL